MRRDAGGRFERVILSAVALLLVSGGCTSGRQATARDDHDPRPPSAAAAPPGLHLRPPREAQPSPTGQAAAARAAFWSAFYGERYDAIPGVIRQLTAAYLENPREPEVALLLAHTHLWKVAERAREDVRDPTVVDHLVLAEHYFEQAYRLNPSDHRIIGWLGSVRLPLGNIRRDSALASEGTLLLAEGVRRHPQFNLFTSAFVRSTLPASDERFQDALAQLWRNIEVCSGAGADTATPEEIYERAARADQTCANSEKAPHNFEGFLLHLGDMLVKSGKPAEATAVYERARATPTYTSWPYRGLLEERIRNAESSATLARAGEPTPMLSGSAYACAACHARR